MKFVNAREERDVSDIAARFGIGIVETSRRKNCENKTEDVMSTIRQSHKLNHCNMLLFPQSAYPAYENESTSQPTHYRTNSYRFPIFIVWKLLMLKETRRRERKDQTNLSREFT